MKLKELEKFRNIDNIHHSRNTLMNDGSQLVQGEVFVNEPNIINAMSDKEGLNKAYSAPSRVFRNNNTLFIAGTSTMQDVVDDLKIPFRETAKAWRYEVANNIINRDSTIDNIVGHSLGGSVALELQKNKPERELRVITYGAPVFDFHSNRNDEK